MLTIQYDIHIDTVNFLIYGTIQLEKIPEKQSLSSWSLYKKQ